MLAGQLVATYTDPLANNWHTRLDDFGFGLVTQTIDPLEHTTSVVRDADGLPIATIDGLGQTTTYQYDSAGNPTHVTLPDGAVYQYQYNAFAQVTQITEPDPDGEGPRPASVWRNVYDSAGNLSEYILPDDDANPDNNPKHVYTYDVHGLMTSATDPRGYTTTYAYDQQGRLIQVVYPTDDQTFTYDDFGNLASVTNERGFTTSFVSDALNRRTATVLPDDDSDPNNNPTWTYAYDVAGNMTAATTPLGHTTSYAFDVMNRLTSITGPDPDGAGSQSAAVTSFGYDAAGRQTSVIDPIGRGSFSFYDAAGRLTRAQRGDSYMIDYGYDDANQLSWMAGPAPDADNPGERLFTSWTHNARGEVTAVSDSTGRLQTFAYNAANELEGFS